MGAFSSKLPDEVKITHLMRHWDKLGHLWNVQDVLGCMIPNRKEDHVVINARRFLLRPEQHWNTVHCDTVKPRKASISYIDGFLEKKSVPSATITSPKTAAAAESSTVTTTSTSFIVN